MNRCHTSRLGPSHLGFREVGDSCCFLRPGFYSKAPVHYAHVHMQQEGRCTEVAERLLLAVSTAAM